MSSPVRSSDLQDPSRLSPQSQIPVAQPPAPHPQAVTLARRATSGGGSARCKDAGGAALCKAEGAAARGGRRRRAVRPRLEGGGARRRAVKAAVLLQSLPRVSQRRAAGPKPAARGRLFPPPICRAPAGEDGHKAMSSEADTASQEERAGGGGNGRQECRFCEMTRQHHPQCTRRLPKRIILVRHGESQGNLDMSAYTTTPDYRIPLTPLGVEQARAAGRGILDMVSSPPADGAGAGAAANWKVYFYVSPYDRTRATLREIGRAFPRHRIIGAREECRVREQDFGNFQVEERMRAVKETRERFGRFFFRFPEGESAADVFDRVASFLESLWRDIDMGRLEQDVSCETNLVIVSHGLTSRVFLMKWFKWTVDQFERLNNFDNCEFRVMQLGPGGEYSLLVHHTKEELERWGLSPEMIADQQWRASSNRRSWAEESSSFIATFFDSEGEEDEEENGKIKLLE